MNRDTLVLYFWDKITAFQLKCIDVVTATQPSSQHHWSRSVPNVSVLESPMSWTESPQSGEIVIAIKGTSACGSRIVSHWGSEPGRLSVLPSWCKTLYCPLKFPLRRRKAPPGTGGIWALGTVCVTGTSSCHRHGGHPPKGTGRHLHSVLKIASLEALRGAAAVVVEKSGWFS